jgi:parvulin-like peptidyl-prolyl isomerase
MAKDNTISASHILIMHTESRNSESKLSKEEALKLANKLHVKLKKDLSAFKDLAINHSSCSSAQYGGSLGEFGKGMMVKQFEEAAFALGVNELSEPIETEFGYHLIKRDS